MRRDRFILFAAILALVLAIAGPAQASTSAADPQHRGGPQPPGRTASFDYYLALGDSLGAGWQPNPVTGVGAITNQGYASDIAADLKWRDPGLRYVNLACPGETTTSMLDGGCPYPESYKDQVDAATAFLSAHRDARVLVTLDIGANDIDGCASATGINPTCVVTGLASVSANLPKILTKLEAAAGRDTEFAAMNYYDPFLAEWLTGPAGQTIATESIALSAEFNAILTAAYTKARIPVADVSGRFDTADLKPLVPLTPTERVPLDVAKICTWTWMCAAPPVNPPSGTTYPAGFMFNIHANATGYRQIADTFEQVIFPRSWA
jgi:lysophospholipase L1-like esterase